MLYQIIRRYKHGLLFYDNGKLIIKEVVVRGGKLYTETSTLTKVEADV